MNDASAASVFAALANETRLAIVRRLVVAGPSGMAAGELAAAVGASPSRASFHLAALSEVGVIASERSSRRMLYRADFGALGALAAYFLSDCCRDAPEVRSCCGLVAGSARP
ncbi:MAG: metalloregulator ArsR/SmtB family transcription factor [Pseudomonadota bacterium]